MHLSSKRVHQIVSRFPKTRVMGVGDVMLDEFIWGRVSRISPEAPVPIVEVSSRSVMPGGAANVVNNIRALGGQAALVGVCGDDPQGATLRQILNDRGVDTEGLLAVEDRMTTLKTRIIAHHQQVVRVDTENKNGHHPQLALEAARLIEQKIDKVDAVIIEDYDKGVVEQALVDRIVTLARKKKKIVAVDPKKGHFLDYRGVTILTPNKGEALAALGIEKEEKAPPLEEIGRRLLKKWECRAVLITLGEEGMLLVEQGKKPFHIPTVAREVFDVSGAGDTVIAALTVSLAGGATFREAAEISNYAAGVVIGKVGTSTVTAKELYQAMEIEHILEG